MRRLAVALVLLLPGCGARKLTSIVGELHVAPRAVTFNRTFVGYSSTAVVQLENASRRPQRLDLRIEPPFSLAHEVLTLAPGEATELTIAFAPLRTGAHTGSLRVTPDGLAPIALPVNGSAADPQPCMPSAPCRATHFDPAAGACVESTLPDGSSCVGASACLVDAVCIAGVCEGQPRACDDGNLCTVDSCDATRGCIHTDATSGCPQPADACHVATCDPAKGCGIADAPDYTPCGAVDCSVAHVCFSGSCRAFTPPDGFPCGQASPCSDAAACASGACVASQVHTLTPSWTYRTPIDGGWTRLADARDESGNLLVLEGSALFFDADGGEERLTSLSPAGAVRWSVPVLPNQGPTYNWGSDTASVFVAGGSVVRVFEGMPGRVMLESRFAFDGGLAWSRDISDVWPAGSVFDGGGHHAGLSRFESSPPVFDGVGRLWMTITLTGPSGASGSALEAVVVDVGTGAVLARANTPTDGTGPYHPLPEIRAGLDGRFFGSNGMCGSNTWASLWGGSWRVDGSADWISLDAGPTSDCAHIEAAGEGVAASLTQMLPTGDPMLELLNTADGGFSSVGPFSQDFVYSPIAMGHGKVAMLAFDWPKARLVVVDARQARLVSNTTPTWLETVGGLSLLPTEDGWLVPSSRARPDAGWDVFLNGADDLGNARFSCPISDREFAGTTLGAEVIFGMGAGGVTAVSLRGVKAPARGWSGARGGYGGGNAGR